MNRVLALPPHTDDAELGCGEAIAKFISQNKTVYYTAFSDCQDTLIENFSKDTLRKKVVRKFINLRQIWKIDK